MMVGGRCSRVIETFKVVSLRVELGLGNLSWESIAPVPGYRLDKVGAPFILSLGQVAILCGMHRIYDLVAGISLRA